MVENKTIKYAISKNTEVLLQLKDLNVWQCSDMLKNRHWLMNICEFISVGWQKAYQIINNMNNVECVAYDTSFTKVPCNMVIHNTPVIIINNEMILTYYIEYDGFQANVRYLHKEYIENKT